MKKKEYKIKVEDGEIKFVDAVDLSNIKEGIVIFFEEDTNYLLSEDNPSGNEKIKKIKAFESVFGLLSDRSEEELAIFEEAVKRRPFFKEIND